MLMIHFTGGDVISPTDHHSDAQAVAFIIG
jgi:hypothetical protein